MRKKFICILALAASHSLFAKGDMLSVDIQAEALAQARDYAGALKLYEKQKIKPIEDWQKQRLTYNMGALLLAQGRPNEALKLFSKVSPTSLSLPRFGSNLYLNAAIAYLHRVQELLPDPYSSIEEQLFLIKASLNAFNSAARTACEGEEGCKESPILMDWKDIAKKMQESVLLQKKKEAADSDSRNDKPGGAAALLEGCIREAEATVSAALGALLHPESDKNESGELLKAQQQRILSEAQPFLLAVLKEQEERFHQTKDLTIRCQNVPWDRVIPLFDRGYRAADLGLKQIEKSRHSLSRFAALQIQAIHDWKEALELLHHPLQEKALPSEAEKKWTDTYQKLQEMYLEDQAKPEQPQQELHTW